MRLPNPVRRRRATPVGRRQMYASTSCQRRMWTVAMMVLLHSSFTRGDCETEKESMKVTFKPEYLPCRHNVYDDDINGIFHYRGDTNDGRRYYSRRIPKTERFDAREIYLFYNLDIQVCFPKQWRFSFVSPHSNGDMNQKTCESFILAGMYIDLMYSQEGLQTPPKETRLWEVTLPVPDDWNECDKIFYYQIARAHTVRGDLTIVPVTCTNDGEDEAPTLVDDDAKDDDDEANDGDDGTLTGFDRDDDANDDA